MRIEVTQGDITRERVDAIINAANKSLRGGGGVDGAIHRAGGPAILEECIQHGGCDTGDAKITTAGDLPAKFVIHTVGPVYNNGQSGEPELLAACHRRSLDVAVENECTAVAFPAIGCGAYGYPVDDAAEIAIATVREFISGDAQIQLVRFVMFEQKTHDAFQRALEKLQ